MAAIDAVLKELDKKFGAGSAMVLTDKPLDIEKVHSGSINLDIALGGGIPLGRVIEIYGAESGGKTTTAVLMAIQFQKKYPDKYVVFIDVEHSFNKDYFIDMGLNPDKFIISQPSSGEEAFDIAESLSRSGDVCLIILDSVSGLSSNAEVEADMEQQSMGLQARLLSKGLRKLTPVLSKHNTTMIFINQIREKIGVFSSYGTPTTTSGGRALPFYASQRIEVKAGEKIPHPTKKDEIIGHQIKIRIVKNKVAPPFRNAIFDLIYGIGVDTDQEIAEYALATGLFSIAGAWIRLKNSSDEIVSRNGTPVNYQGKPKFFEYFKSDAELVTLFKDSLYNERVLTVEDLIPQ